MTFNGDKFVVDYDGDIYVKNKTLDTLTNGIFQWGEVGKDFRCAWCGSLKSLKGAPEKVGGSFYCDDCVPNSRRLMLKKYQMWRVKYIVKK